MVYSYWEHINEERVLFRRRQPELGTGAEEEWADVHACARLMRGDKFGVFGDCEMDGLEEKLNWWLGNGDERGGVLHSTGILIWTEDANLAIFLAEGFEALVTVLALGLDVSTK